MAADQKTIGQSYNIVHNILTNPIYAGAYAFGRTTSRGSVENGRKRVRRGVYQPPNGLF
jgi:hypothetical protein